MLTIRLAVKDGLNETDPAMAGFKGFMVMAFDASGVNIEPIGMFHIPATTDVQTMNCPSSNGNINSQVKLIALCMKLGHKQGLSLGRSDTYFEFLEKIDRGHVDAA